MKVAIVGYGWVGKAMHKLFPDALIYDKYNPELKSDIKDCDIAFIGVPSPWDSRRMELDCSEVEDAIKNTPVDLIVIRSATNPHFADRMSRKYNKRIVVQPEYLGESPSHPMLEMDSRSFIIVGGNKEDCREVINCYTTVYNANVKIRQVTALEAEVIKLTENRAIFFKLMQCQELYDACEASGVDYYTVRDAVYGDDPRFNLWWTFVYPDNRGANSKCIPKDVYAWLAWAESSGMEAGATRELLKYNEALIGVNDEG